MAKHVHPVLHLWLIWTDPSSLSHRSFLRVLLNTVLKSLSIRQLELAHATQPNWHFCIVLEKINYIFYLNKAYNCVLTNHNSIKQPQESLPFNVHSISPLRFPAVINIGPKSNSEGQIMYHFCFCRNHLWFVNCKTLNDLVKNWDSNCNLVMAKLNIHHRWVDAISQAIVLKPLKLVLAVKETHFPIIVEKSYVKWPRSSRSLQ